MARVILLHQAPAPIRTGIRTGFARAERGPRACANQTSLTGDAVLRYFLRKSSDVSKCTAEILQVAIVDADDLRAG